MHITTEVHVPHGLCPAIGLATDWDSMVTLLFHHTNNEWSVMGALRSGSSDFSPVKECFSVDHQIVANLDLRLHEARAAVRVDSAVLDDLVIKS